MRHTRSHTANRRSHHALKRKLFSIDKETGVAHLRHHVSLTTGTYRGKTVMNVTAKAEKKAAKAKALKK
jgi:ribosomal protein L32